MKKRITILGFGILVCAAVGVAFSQQASQTQEQADISQTSVPGNVQSPAEMPAGRTMGMPGAMMKMMPPRSMVASSDGGIIVLNGNKLMKFDKDLTLVKEIELKGENPPMAGKMGKMNCSMMEQKPESGKDGETAPHEMQH